jgi:hypothetical protein
MTSPSARISSPPAGSFAQILAFLQPGYSRCMAGPEKEAGAKLSVAGWITIIVLVGLLGWAIWYAIGAWRAMAGVHMSVLGWVFLAMGVVVTFLVGAGLMALVFYSSRHDLDR